ncbi:hypothetical protein J14TS2_21060 [Bacillus sp. J14TS2]|uniref:hypothetical protein n=1 Tax=Bacillus sp. J14TS2 TaxID=2807188 RepID=UPI001B0E8C78|nr:hypothetical protein [Bacillus sp. J14TS2]GIN71631.1 hypothetical protein J14TS2_21060 [Bacillus sp. J14TS2]
MLYIVVWTIIIMLFITSFCWHYISNNSVTIRIMGRIITELLYDFNLFTICVLYYPKLMEQNKTPYDIILEQVHLLMLKVYLNY